MNLIICEVHFILTWSSTCVISSATGETKIKITDTKLYVPVVTLSTQDNAKLLQKSRTINWNKYQSNPFSIRTSKCSGSGNNINDPYEKTFHVHYYKYKCLSIYFNVKN